MQGANGSMEYRTGILLMGGFDRALSPDFFVVKGRLARAFIATT